MLISYRKKEKACMLLVLKTVLIKHMSCIIKQMQAANIFTGYIFSVGSF